MQPAAWPDWLEDTWAKSANKGEQRGESLAQHTWLVLSRLADLQRLRPDLPQVVGVSKLWHYLFWTCMLHDFGKAAQGFQGMLHGKGRWKQRHEVLSLAFLD
jgi:CRISPR-associated endonuclease/helicase Cas3